MSKPKVCVVGLGYIGLPTAALLAHQGYDVAGVDVVPRVVETINQGRIHIVEAGLADYVKWAVKAGHLRAFATPQPAQVFMIAVPTPFKGDYEPDLTYVEQAARSLAPVLADDDLVILESTSPVGATELVQAWLSDELGKLGRAPRVHLAYCPERVIPGRILHELVHNDRVVGGLTEEATRRAAEFYRSFIRGKALETHARTAEMTKLVENSFRDVNIAFANELSIICDREEIDVWELIGLANHHPRVDILQPGPGVGGHCIAVDPWFLVHKHPIESKLIRTAREVNDSKPGWVIDKVAGHVRGIEVEAPTIVCLGLAYKSDVDDLRESPSLAIAQRLAQAYPGQVIACEPNLDAAEVQGLALVSLEEAMERAQILVVLVRHREFLGLSLRQLEGKRLVDACGLLASKG